MKSELYFKKGNKNGQRMQGTETEEDELLWRDKLEEEER